MSAAREAVVTKSELISGLRAIGVEPGQTIMLHVSIKAIGWIIGGPDVLIEALLECLQDKGTIMMYAGWEERPEHFDRWSAERQRAFLRECPPFIPERSRANRKRLAICAISPLRGSRIALRSTSNVVAFPRLRCGFAR